MSSRKILLIDDDVKFATEVQKALGRAFFVTHAAGEKEFHTLFAPYTFDLIILDMRLKSGREGLWLLREILGFDELQPVIMVSAYGDTDAVLDAAEGGALMFLHKQEFTPELLTRMVEAVLQQARIRRHLAALKNRVEHETPVALTSTNPAIRRATDLAFEAADEPESMVLVSGEDGVGHELLGLVIHDRSRRRSEAPFVTACGNPSSMGDPHTALFGTPSRGGGLRRKGLFEQANGGVLFFDRMDVLESEARSSLIETLRDRALRLAWMDVPIPLDVQFVAGTVVDRTGSVRDALRTSSIGGRLIEIYLPPLRERQDDVPVLATHFLQRLRREGKTSAKTFSRDALDLLERYPWPGNLPELQNVVEFGAIQAFIDEKDEISLAHLPAQMRGSGYSSQFSARLDYRFHLAQAEVALVYQAIKERGALSKSQLAELLGYTDRFAFTRRIRKALGDYPEIAREFNAVSALFRIRN